MKDQKATGWPRLQMCVCPTEEATRDGNPTAHQLLDPGLVNHPGAKNTFLLLLHLAHCLATDSQVFCQTATKDSGISPSTVWG